MPLKKLLQKERKKHHNETRLAFQKIIMKGDHNKDDHDNKNNNNNNNDTWHSLFILYLRPLKSHGTLSRLNNRPSDQRTPISLQGLNHSFDAV